MTLRQDLDRVLGDGDALIIVPPYAQTNYAHLGAHVLQACAKEAGFDVRVLYANILWASLIGVERYQLFTVHSGVMLAERSFARAAFGTAPWGRNADQAFAEVFVPASADDLSGVWANTVSDSILQLGEPEIGCAPAGLDGAARAASAASKLDEIERLAPGWTDAVAEAVARCGYKVVGATTSVEQMAASIALLKRIKARQPDAIAILGGANCDGEMADAAAELDPAIDHVFSGESDVIFPQFLRDVFSGKAPEAKILRGEPMLKMDDLPAPDFSEFFEQFELFLTSQGKAAKPDSMPYETSRGCWWGQKHHCTFCGINGSGMGFRHKSPERALTDMRALRAAHGNLRFVMSDAIMPWSYRKTLLPQLAQEEPLFRLAYEEKANLSLKDIMLLRGAGADWIVAGIEALSSGLLKLMNKGVLARQNVGVLRYARLCGVTVSWTMIFAFPQDRREHYEETLRLLPLIHHLQPPQGVFPIVPTRFSPYFNDPERYGISGLKPLKAYGDIYPAHVDLMKLAYNFDADYPTHYRSDPEMTGQIEDAVAAWKACWSSGHRSTVMLRATEFEGDLVIIRDTRGLDGSDEHTVVPRSDAVDILTQQPHDPASKVQSMAVEKRFGVILDGCYVPLATAAPKFLAQLEEEAHARRFRARELTAAE